jgi:hypothetical protein
MIGCAKIKVEYNLSHTNFATRISVRSVVKRFGDAVRAENAELTERHGLQRAQDAVDTSNDSLITLFVPNGLNSKMHGSQTRRASRVDSERWTQEIEYIIDSIGCHGERGACHVVGWGTGAEQLTIS